MRILPTQTLLIASCLLALSGCGQKDALYLPEDPSAQTTDSAQDKENKDTQKKQKPPAE